MKYKVNIANIQIGGDTIDEMILQLQSVVGSADYTGQVAAIMDSIQSLTPEMPIVFEENDTQSVLAHLEYGPHHGRPFHKISYKPSYKLWLHAAAHELMYLEMYTKATLCQRGIVFKRNEANDISFNKRFGQAFTRLADATFIKSGAA